MTMALGFLFLHFFVYRQLWLLLHKYSEHGELDEFITRAPLDEIIRLRFLATNLIVTFGLFSISLLSKL